MGRTAMGRAQGARVRDRGGVGSGGFHKAHVKAIDGMNGKGVLTEADFNAINTGLGKAISSVPESTVMDVYNEMSGLLGGSKFGQVPQYVYSKQSGSAQGGGKGR